MKNAFRDAVRAGRKHFNAPWELYFVQTIGRDLDSCRSMPQDHAVLLPHEMCGLIWADQPRFHHFLEQRM